MRTIGAALFALTMAGAASAAEIVIPVAEGTQIERVEAIYDCGRGTVGVTYINAGSILLAVLVVDGEQVVASNVLSGSGARYAGSRYVWWTKGDEASLYDLMQDGEDTPVASCTATP